MHLYLASTSPARLSLLRSAGIEPVTFTPEVDEELAVADHEERLGRTLDIDEMVLFLAQLKAEDVAKRHADEIDGLVLGGDSAFLLDGAILGKPHLPDVAFARAQAHRGRTGVLHSGHWLIDCTRERRRMDAQGVETGSGPVATGAVRQADVTLAEDVSDAELTAYVDSGEPLQVAGGFTIDGKAAAFIDNIVGDPSCVIGLSLPTLRRMVRELGYDYTSLWNR
jgi:septum formation protein